MPKRIKEVRKAPAGIKFISILLIVMSFIFIVLGIGLIKVGFTISQHSDLLSTFTRLILAGETDTTKIDTIGYSSIPALMDYAGPALIATGIALIIFGLIRIFIGFHLWNGRTWTRVIILSFSVVWISFGIYGITQGIIIPNIIALLVNFFVLYYIMFNSHARQFLSHLDN